MFMIEQRKHGKYDMYINFHVYFLCITCKSIIGDNDYTVFRALLMLKPVRTVVFLRVSINQYPQHFWALLHNFLFTRWSVLLEPLLLTCSAFVYCLKKENISNTYYSQKNVLILILFHLFIKSIHW